MLAVETVDSTGKLMAARLVSIMDKNWGLSLVGSLETLTVQRQAEGLETYWDEMKGQMMAEL